MSEYASEIRIRFYDDNGALNIKDLFETLQNLKAKDYLKLYQMMYQDLVEHQQLHCFQELTNNLEKKENNI